MKIKVCEATPLQLDWLVAKCEGLAPRFFTEKGANMAHVVHQNLKYGDYVVVLRPNKILTLVAKYDGYNDWVCWKDTYTPSTDWSQGGPIIEREGINIDCLRCDGNVVSWIATKPMIEKEFYEWLGSSLLITAMRCYVASKLGDEVEVPDELI